MLKYANIIEQLSDSDKISILCDIQRLADKKYKLMGIPSVHIVSLEDHLTPEDPSPDVLSNCWDSALVESVALRQLHHIAATGADLVIVPGPRPKVDPYQSALSEDPNLSAAMADAYQRAARQTGLSLCLDGFSVTEPDLKWLDTSPDIRVLQQFWVAPYCKALQQAPCAVVLTAPDLTVPRWESVNSGLSKALARQLPNRNCFFICPHSAEQTVAYLLHGGICLSGSALALQAALDHYHQIQANIKIGTSTTEFLNQELACGRAVCPENLDEATDRLLDFAFSIKRKAALLPEMTDPVSPQEGLFCSAVLLKNDGVLPLPQSQTICMIGDIAFLPRTDGGSLLSDLQGLFADQNKPVVGTDRGYDLSVDRSDERIAPALALARNADLILLFLGLGSIRQANSQSLGRISIPANQQALLDQLSRLGKKIIAIAPPECCPDLVLTDRCNAILLAPLNSPASGRVLWDILSGNRSPEGRLAATVYDSSDRLYLRHRNARQCHGLRSGCFIGYRYYATANDCPGFPFGHGLGYGKLSYSHLLVSDGLARLTLTNKGHTPVAEVVQIYVGKLDATDPRPKMELAGHQKITLTPGQTQTVLLSIPLPRVYDPDTDSFVEESGTYCVYAGSSVADIRLTQTMTVNGHCLPAQGETISDYILSESNIFSDHFKLEAKYKTMKKSAFNFIVGGSALGLAIALKMYCSFSNISSSFFDIFSLILAAAGVYFIILEVVNRNKAYQNRQKAVDAATEQQFKETHAQTITVSSAQQMFVTEFDTPDAPQQELPEQPVEGVEAPLLAYIDKEQTFPAAINDFCIFARERGCELSADRAGALFAALATSHLLVVNDLTAEAFSKFMSIVSSYFGTPLYLDQVDDRYTTAEQMLTHTDENRNVTRTNAFGAISAARNDPSQIYFIALDQVDPQQLPRYFTPYIKFIRSPQTPYTVSLPNCLGVSETHRIAPNVWFVLNLADGKTADQIPGFISDAACVDGFSFDECEPSDILTQVRRFSCHQMDYLAEKAVNGGFISEDNWKKVDRLEQFFPVADGTLIDNKLWLYLEKYAHIALACGEEVSTALDHAVCVKLMSKILWLHHNTPAENAGDLNEILERVLGEEGSIACKKLAHQCTATHN